MYRPNNIWETPPMLTLLDDSLKDIGLFYILHYVMWNVLWPTSEMQSQWQYTFGAVLVMRVLRLGVITLWPMSTKEYISNGMDFIGKTQSLLLEEFTNKRILPLEISMEQNAKIRE